MIDNPNYQDFATHDDSAYPELWNGCVGAWAPCLGPSGTRLHDHSGKQNWGTLANMDAATDWVVDGGRYALDFDGSNDYVDCGTHPGFVDGSFFTVAGWLKINAVVTNGGILSGDRGISVGVDGWHFRTLSSGAIRWIVYSGNGATFRGADSAVLNLGQWYFFCGDFTSSGATLTVDRTAYAQSVVALGLPSVVGAFPLWFARYGTAYGNTRLDDVKIWRRQLTASEKGLLYDIGRGGVYAPRRRRKAYFGQQFNAAWARGSNQFIQPSLIGVA